jgi:hypothetical protein
VRGSSRRLVALFVLAVIAIVVAIDFVVWLAMGHHPVDGQPAASNLSQLLSSSVIVLAGIGLSSLFRIMSLSDGGKSVAESVGAAPVPPDTADPALRRLRNVIEEVAIAAGVPVVPVAISGSGAVLPAAGFKVRPGVIRLRFGAPIPTTDLAVEDRNTLARQARDAVIDLLHPVHATADR